MSVQAMFCPACSHPLPPETQPNTLVTCPACNSTLYLSDWEIGKNDDGIAVATPTRVYTVTDHLAKDDVCNVYRCRYKLDDKNVQGMFRVSRTPTDNDLVQNEAQILYHLHTIPDYEDFRAFTTPVLENFIYSDKSLQGAHQVNIVSLHEHINGPNELYSLEEIWNYYPSGIDPRDMAWMWRRLLFVLGFVHKSGVVHGGILPSHVLIEPKDHKLVLTGWGFGVRKIGNTWDRLKAVSVTYEKWYPPEVFDKKPASPGFDVVMGARCMMYLIGADPLDNMSRHRNMEDELARYFTNIINTGPRNRPGDAWKLLSEFDRIIEKLWGPRTFRVFTMPYKS